MQFRIGVTRGVNVNWAMASWGPTTPTPSAMISRTPPSLVMATLLSCRYGRAQIAVATASVRGPPQVTFHPPLVGVDIFIRCSQVPPPPTTPSLVAQAAAADPLRPSTVTARSAELPRPGPAAPAGPAPPVGPGGPGGPSAGGNGEGQAGLSKRATTKLPSRIQANCSCPNSTS